MISTTGPVTGNRMVTSAPSPRSTSGRLVGTSRTVVLRFLAEAFFPFLVGWTLSSGAGRRMAPFPQPHQLLSRRPRPDAYEAKARARQNVIFELGFFMAKLGRRRTCALYEDGVELLSDFSGVLYVPLDRAEAWKFQLARELKAAGFPVDMNDVV